MPLVDGETKLYCGIVLTVACTRGGHMTERSEYFPPGLVAGLPLSSVGTALQRQVYETLAIVYGDLLLQLQREKQGLTPDDEI